MSDAMALLQDKDLLDSLYGFAYKRTRSAQEAEDLCSDIIVSIVKSLRNNSEIRNLYAFIWTIAHRVYADFSEKRKIETQRNIIDAFSDEVINISNNPIDDYLDEAEDQARLKLILREISFLSKIYRDVCVMYYLEEMKISDIAARLNVSENTVKQRLHSSRSTIRKGVEKMNTNLILKPIDIAYIGTGNPVGNDPRTVAERSFSKNLIYLCKDTERSTQELSELLCVPMPFIEEEVEIQVNGQNGYYGLLQKTENGKYISNFILVDFDNYMKVNNMLKRNTDTLVSRYGAYLKKNEQRLLNLPFLNQKIDMQLLSWILIRNLNWRFESKINTCVEEKYFRKIAKTKRDFYTFGIAFSPEQQFDIGFYGCDGISGYDIGGYKSVFLSNMYGRRVNAHFHCGHNISLDPELILTVKAIGGLALSSLSDSDKETAAKAISSGYIYKDSNVLYPKILVCDSESVFEEILNGFMPETDDLIDGIADEMYRFIKNSVPKHMINEYGLFIQMTSIGLLDALIEKSIETGIICIPEQTPGAEGVLIAVQK